MGAFSLTNSALLGGLVLIGAPILAHLFQRRARRPIVFPSIAFLQECVAQQSKLHRLRRLILLALRMLAVACIVMAFTRPVWFNSQLVSASDPDAPLGVVIVLDASLSTSQQSGAESVFDRLKGSAAETLNTLRSGVDVANVVIADDMPHTVFPRMSPNLPALATEVNRMTAGQSRADLRGAMNVAARLLVQHEGPRRLVILSDFQKTNWSENFGMADGRTTFPPGTEIVLTDLSAKPPVNVGLANPECFPAIPVAGQTVDLTVSLLNSGEESRQSTVQLEVTPRDGGSPITQEQTILLGPNTSRRLTFSVPLTTAAAHAVEFRLKENDGLPGDNRAWLAIGSAQPVPVLVVSDDDSNEPGNAAFYLMRALAPYNGLTDVSAVGRLSPRHLRLSELKADDLKGVSVVFLGYLGVLPEGTASLLTQYIQDGGGLVLFAGDGPADKNAALLNESAGGHLLPWQLVSRETSTRTDPMRVTSGRWQSRWFREFDEQSQLAIEEIGFRKIWKAGTAAADAEVLLLFSGNQPALGARAYGRGQFLLANFSPEAASSDLGKHGPFVALIQMLASTLHRPAGGEPQDVVGQPIHFTTLVQSTASRVLNPDGAEVVISRSTSAEGARVTVSRTDRAGLYRLEVDGEVVEAAAVSCDARESDLRIADVEAIEAAMRSADSSQGKLVRRASVAGSLDLEGRPLWGESFVLALGMIALELLLLGIWRR